MYCVSHTLAAMARPRVLLGLLLLCLCYGLGSASIDPVDEAAMGVSRSVKSGYTLNTLEIMLPLDHGEGKVSYMLSASRGCYEWTASSSFLVLEPVAAVNDKDYLSQEARDVNVDAEEGAWQCVRQVRVSYDGIAVSERKSGYVVAKEKNTGYTLKCEVVVDYIHNVDIVSVAKTLAVGSTKLYRALAYDQYGNAFTTLDGTTFEWSVEGGEEMLQFINFRDSSYKTSESLLDLEESSRQGDRALIQGMAPGYATLKLRKIVLGKEVSATVQLAIIEPFYLNTGSSVYVTVDSTIDLLVSKPLSEEESRLADASGQFEVEIADSSVCEWVSSDGVLKAVGEGSSVVKVSDASMKDNYVITVVHVVEIDKISASFFLSQSYHKGLRRNNSFLESGKNYTIVLQCYDNMNRAVNLPESAVVSVDVGNGVDTVSKSKDSTIVEISAVNLGTFDVQLKLGIVFDSGKELKLENKLQYVVSKPIAFAQSVMRIPFTGFGETYSLNAKGGTGTYLYETSADANCVVDPEGEILVVKNGLCEILVLDKLNVENTNLVGVNVGKIEKIEFESNELFVLSGQDSEIVLHLLGSFSNCEDDSDCLEYFTDCSGVRSFFNSRDLEVMKIVDGKLKPPSTSKGCALLFVVGGSTGTSVLSGGMKTQTEAVETDAVVHVFAPLKVLLPFDEEEGVYVAAVPLHTFAQIEVVDGPGAVIGTKDKFVEKIVFDTEIAGSFAKEYFVENDRRFFLISSSKSIVTFGWINVMKKSENDGLDEQMPGSSRRVKFVSSEPKEISLDARARGFMDCPCGDPAAHSVLLGGEVEVHLSVAGAGNYAMQNISSLEFEWSFSNPGFVSYSNLNDPSLSVSEKYIIVGNQSGALDIHIDYLDRNNGENTSLLRASKTVYISQSTSLFESGEKALAAEEFSGLEIPVSFGSGCFEVVSEPEGCCSGEFVSDTRSVVIFPAKPGVSHLRLVDKCMEANDLDFTVSVSDKKALKITGPSQMQVDSKDDVKVKVFDGFGNPFTGCQLDGMAFSHSVSAGLVSVEETGLSSDDKTDCSLRFEKRFKVISSHIGTEGISFTLHLPSGNQLESNLLEMNIFQEASLHPSTVRLVPGSNFQLTVEGGPISGVERRYHALNGSVVSVDSDGVLQALHEGESAVYVDFYGVNSEGEFVGLNLTALSAWVEVVPLTAVKIEPSALNLKVDNIVKVSSVSISGDDPFAFATASYNYSWHSSNPEVLEIVRDCPIEFESCIDDYAVIVKGRMPGTSTLTLKMDRIVNKEWFGEAITFSDAIVVTVSSGLIVKPSSHILLPVFSSSQLEVNFRDCEYNVHMGSNVVSVSERGLISSERNVGNFIVSVSCIDSFGNRQTEVVNGLVKEVKSVLFSASYQMSDDITTVQKTIPVGISSSYFLNLLDEHGNLFEKPENVNLYISCSHEDIVRYSYDNSGVLTVSALREGSAVLRVSSSDNKIVDFIRVKVSAGIFPSNPVLHYGAHLCFKASVPSTECRGEMEGTCEQESGSWKSSANDALKIDADSGQALSFTPELNSGAAVRDLAISYTSGFKTYTNVTISPVLTIGVDIDQVEYVSNIFLNSTEAELVYRFPIHFFGMRGKTNVEFSSVRSCRDDGSYEQQIFFRCKLSENNDFFNSYEEFDKKTGQSFCIVLPKFGDHYGVKVGKLPLSIVAYDKNETYQYAHEERLPFMPGFVVNRTIVVLGLGKYSESFVRVLYGLQDDSAIAVSVEGSSLIEVAQMPSLDSSDIGSMVYRIRLKDQWVPSESLLVEFSNIVTGQKASVTVAFSTDLSSVSGQVREETLSIKPIQEAEEVDELYEKVSNSGLLDFVFEFFISVVKYLIIIAICVGVAYLVVLLKAKSVKPGVRNAVQSGRNGVFATSDKRGDAGGNNQGMMSPRTPVSQLFSPSANSGSKSRTTYSQHASSPFEWKTTPRNLNSMAGNDRSSYLEPKPFSPGYIRKHHI
eukprot:Nk52_evm25s250 gene=Nk52_evmTU25s250